MNTEKADGLPQGGRVLVTGGTGFLGAYILQNLVVRGIPVRAIRRTSKLPHFIAENVLRQVEWVDGDVLDVVSLDEAMEGVDAVIHSAAVVSFAKEARKEMYGVNVEGTTNVVNMALEKGLQRMVHISSVAALGRTRQTETVSEEKKWTESSNNTHYAISKHWAEMQVWRGFAEGLDGVILNPSTILGYGDWHQSSSAIFKNTFKLFPWYTRGVNGFVGVEDVAEVAVRSLYTPINHKRFIVNAENWSFQQLLTTIAKGFDIEPPRREASPLMGAIAWRLEGLKAALTGKKPLLTRETARVAQSQTSFNNRALLEALPGFAYTPLEKVIQRACDRYKSDIARRKITV